MQVIYLNIKEQKMETLEELVVKYASIWTDIFNREYRYWGGHCCLDDVIIEATDVFEEEYLWEQGYKFVKTVFNVPTNYNILLKGTWGYPVEEEV